MLHNGGHVDVGISLSIAGVEVLAIKHEMSMSGKHHSLAIFMPLEDFDYLLPFCLVVVVECRS